MAGVLLSFVVLLLAPTRVAAEPAVLVVKGDYHLPQFSPDGKTLLVTGARMHGLNTVNLASGKATLLLDEAGIGVHARYLPDGRIAFRAKRAGSTRDLALAPSGKVTLRGDESPVCFAHKDRIYLQGPSGPMQVGSGDRFFDPQLSPDKSKLVFVGLATGIYVYEIESRRLTHLGPGTSPRWAPNSKRLAYEWTEDDGHVIVASDLWLWDSESGSVQLTKSNTRLERHPSFSPDGLTIAFDDDNGSVYTMGAEVLP